MDFRTECDYIVKNSINRVLPDEAVKRALDGRSFPDGKLILVSIGKAGWSMAYSAAEILKDRITEGIVITKHGYSQGGIDRLKVFEAGHPVPDEDTLSASSKALEMTESLSENDTVILLISGGGSALFEMPYVDLNELQSITSQLLECGADIVEINTIRKRLSKVKGGRFAAHCAPASVFAVVLSDIIGDPLDMIASGPAYPDSSTCADAIGIVRKYGIRMSEEAAKCLTIETPKEISNVETEVTGSVRELCIAAAESCRELGYEPRILTDCLSGEARDAGKRLAGIVIENRNTSKPLAVIAGGETVVHITGHGKGGRNQEIALSAARYIAGINNAAVFSTGSDGTDGPTDAAGGYVDGSTIEKLSSQGIDADAALADNDSYNALSACGGLIFTGATGTNVNDVSVALIKKGS